MKKMSRYHSHAVACTLAVLSLSAATARAAVTADPAHVTFNAPDQSFTITLYDGGTPIRGNDITSWRLLASGHDYKHMIDVETSDGAIRVSPSTTVELGSYDLEIETARGPVTVRVLTPLNEVPDVVEKMAMLTGESEQKIAEKLGLAASTGRATIQLDLPPIYYEGETVDMALPVTPGEGRTGMWFVNGDAVAQDPAPSAFTYTFKAPGDYIVNYIETTNESGANVVAARATAFTRVVLRPAVPTNVAANTTVSYAAPPGYQNYVWSLDGETVSEEAILKHTFLNAGAHIVECLASSPDRGPAGGFLRVRYNTTVSPA